MAQVIDKLPPRSVAHRGPKYHFEQWADGRVWAMAHGEDYMCKHKSFILACRRWAWKHGLRLDYRHLREDGEQIGWAIQFVDDGRAPKTGSLP